MAVITISRQVESLGTEIAQGVASKLNYKYLDRKGIEQALTAYGLVGPEAEKFDEKSPPFWVNWQIQGRKFLNSLQTVIYEAARQDNVVIVGRGGQALLKGIPGVIHVRIIAPFPDRIRRFAEKDIGNKEELPRIMKQRDRDSEGFIRTFFGADWEDVALYDLVINTRYVTVDVGVQMIMLMIPVAEAMSRIAHQSRERLDNLILQYKLETVLLNANLGAIHFELVDGVVTLRGNVFSREEGESLVRLVSGVEGVRKVENKMVAYKDYVK